MAKSKLFLSVLILLISSLLFTITTIPVQASSNNDDEDDDSNDNNDDNTISTPTPAFTSPPPNPNPPLMKIIDGIPMLFNGTVGGYTDEVITPSHLFQQVDPDLKLALDPNT